MINANAFDRSRPEHGLDLEQISACPLCGGSNLVPWRLGCSDSTGLAGGLDYHRCTVCGCRVLVRRPDEASVASLYGHDYGPYVNTTAAIEMHVVGAGGPSGPLRAALARTYSDPREGARVLDFGCGSSAFVDAARCAGWRTVAADFTETGISGPRACGHDVRLVDDDFWSWMDTQQFDVIRLSHVVEHLHDPLRELARLLAALRPGGQLHVITPNPEGPACTLARRHSNFFQMVHVTLIPPTALTRAVRRLGVAGTEVVFEPTTKDLWRSLLLTTRTVLSYERAPIAPRSALLNKLLRRVCWSFDRRGRSDRYHAFIRA